MQAVTYRLRKRQSGPVASANAAAAGAGGAAVSLSNQIADNENCTVEAELTKTVTVTQSVVNPPVMCRVPLQLHRKPWPFSKLSGSSYGRTPSEAPS